MFADLKKVNNKKVPMNIFSFTEEVTVKHHTQKVTETLPRTVQKR